MKQKTVGTSKSGRRGSARFRNRTPFLKRGRQVPWNSESDGGTPRKDSRGRFGRTVASKATSVGSESYASIIKSVILTLPARRRHFGLNITGINGLRRFMPCRLLIFSNQVVSR